jgi:hypothetical protein
VPGFLRQTFAVTDHYADGTYRWWHLSGPSPELLHALTDAWLPATGRILKPGGKLLLRASLRAAGVRNNIDESVMHDTFSAWQIDELERAEIPSDTRTLEVLLVRLTR